MLAKLEEVRDDGILLSEMSELGPRPTMFCPWDSLKRYSQWMPWLGMPHERRLRAKHRKSTTNSTSSERNLRRRSRPSRRSGTGPLPAG